ncbi:MAG: WbqC family protein [Bdellovibrionaceae bacterium]|nr:WbqC family protein [Pseudobdellovibrionaceae bacterium]
MNTTISIIQPSFLPWQGYFAFIKRSQHFIFYDDVQYDKHGWRNRNRCVLNNELKWLSVPVKTKNRFGQKIYETAIDNDQNWSRKILGQLKQSYRTTPYFEDYYSWIEKRLNQEWLFIADLDIALTKDIANFLHLNCQFHRSSEIPIDPQLDRLQRLIFLIKKLNGSHYLSGPSAKNYIDSTKAFTKENIHVEFFHYTQPLYPQQKALFIKSASIIDLLFHTGPKAHEFI